MTRDEAVSIASRLAAEKGWRWEPPIVASRRGGLLFSKRWEVVSNSDKRGCNVRVVINDRDGSVVSSAFCPR